MITRSRTKLAGILTAATVGVLALSTTPAAAYPGGDYTLTMQSIQIYDIAGTIDPHQQCAEIFGKVTVSRGGQTITFFQADEKHYTEVCEPDRPINEGTQSGLLYASAGGYDKLTSKFKGTESQDEPFVFKVDLWDADTVNDDHLIDNQTVRVYPKEAHLRDSRVYFEDGNRWAGVQRTGHKATEINYAIDKAPGQGLEENLTSSLFPQGNPIVKQMLGR